MKIALIGLPLSGKSTLGGVLAKELFIENVDIDSIIEEKYGSIPNLINHDEAGFRYIENKILKEQIKKNKRKSHVLVGGSGIVEDPENIELLKDYFKVYIMIKDMETWKKDIQERRTITNINRLLKRQKIYERIEDITIWFPETRRELCDLITEIEKVDFLK